jgi:tRNA(Ile)-lysidine synthase TilS/MesJ
MNGRRVVVGMSGGVDSSLAAALLVEQGFEVIGMTMHLARSASRCCSLDDAHDARRVADQLGIRFYVANTREFHRRDAAVRGRLPRRPHRCPAQPATRTVRPLSRARSVRRRWRPSTTTGGRTGDRPSHADRA